MTAQTNIKPLSLKCRICGGNLIKDYMNATCKCENCGNTWALYDMLPRAGEYSHIIDKIRKAMEMASDADNPVNLGQARIMFNSAEADCLRVSNEITAELLRVCNEGQEQVELIRRYTTGKNLFEKKKYQYARSEFEKIADYKDSASYIGKCDVEIAASRKKRIPFAVIVGMILPAILAIFLYEVPKLPIPACIPIFLVVAGGLGYAIYRGGTLAIIVEIISFVLIVPLLMFMIMTYGFHLAIGLSLKLSIGIPFAVVVIIVVLAEIGGKRS